MSLIAIYIPCRDEKEARKISTVLLEKKLIACANIWPVQSLYKWKGKLAEEKEVVVFAKSTEEKYREITRQARIIHSYELPAIVKFRIETNKDYEIWLRKKVNQ